MLKKLVKYGNSSALLLDKTILSLIDCKSDSVLKLRVEGDSLIIKVQEETKPTDTVLLDLENRTDKFLLKNGKPSTFMEATMANMREQCEKLEKDPKTLEAMKNWLPGTKNAKKLQEAYAEIMAKYSEEIKPLSSKEFVDEAQALNDKYEGNSSNPEYMHEFLKLRLKHAPGLDKMDQEMKDITKSLGCPAEF